MDLKLGKRHVVIAGATGGLGAACARAFAAEGARLSLLGRSAEKLAALVRELTSAGGQVIDGIQTDLTDWASTDAAVASAVRQGGPIDVLVSAAGNAQGGIFTDLSDADWKRNLELKLFGTIRLLRAALPGMLARRAGRIVVIVGNSAKLPEPRMLPGAAANSALLAIVRGLAEEVGPQGVCINAVNPGPVRSSRWDQQMADIAAQEKRTVADVEAPFLAKSALRKLGSAEQVAAQVLFLASELAGHTTGTSITLDGGSVKTP
jgi:NAD(P)-dependent dehydrogenase (short-subunit alcohol dehydrogenase family)